LSATTNKQESLLNQSVLEHLINFESLTASLGAVHRTVAHRRETFIRKKIKIKIMAKAASSSSSCSLKLRYTEEGDGLYGKAHFKLIGVREWPSTTLTARDLVDLLFDDGASIERLTSLRCLADNVSWQLQNDKYEWRVVSADQRWRLPSSSVFALYVHIGSPGKHSDTWVRRRVRSLKAQREQERAAALENRGDTLRQIESGLESLASLTESNCGDDAARRREARRVCTRRRGHNGAVTIARLKLLAHAVEKGWGRSVAVPLMRALRSLTLDGWQQRKPNGVLLHGPPGTGKSWLCEMVMRELTEGNEYVLFSGVAAQLNEKYVGEAEKRLKALADTARDNSDKLFFLFIDEVHGLASRQQASGGGGQSSGSSSSGKQDLLLSLLEIMTKHANIIFLFATNFLAALDPAFLRSKRVDVQILVPSSSFAQRQTYFDEHIEPLLGALADRAAAEQRSQLFAFWTTNFSKAQLATLRDRVQDDVSLGHVEAATRNDDDDDDDDEIDSECFWHFAGTDETRGDDDDGVPLSMADVEAHVVDIAQQGSEYTRALFDSVFRNTTTRSGRALSGYSDDHELLAWARSLHNVADDEVTGRIALFGRSGVVSFEGPSPRSDMASYAMRLDSDDRAIALTMRSLMSVLHPLDAVFVVDGTFRNKHERYLDEALDALLAECREMRGRCLIVIEYDDVVGMVVDSMQRTVTYSTSTTGSQALSSQTSLSFADTWNLSRTLSRTVGHSDARSLSRTESEQHGTSAVKGSQSGTTMQLSDSVARALALSDNWGRTRSMNASHTFGTSYTESRGSSHTKSSSRSASIGLGTFSVGASSGTSTTQSAGNAWGRSDNWTTGHSQGASSGGAHAKTTSVTGTTAQGSSASSSHQEGENKSSGLALQQANTSTTSDSESSALADTAGGSSGRSVAMGSSQSLALANSAGSNVTLGMRVQYPRAAHSLARLMSKINRKDDPSDPFLLNVFRVTEPPLLAAVSPLQPPLPEERAKSAVALEHAHPPAQVASSSVQPSAEVARLQAKQ
jgi:ATPase family associated with various cellular activities (AAA)